MEKYYHCENENLVKPKTIKQTIHVETSMFYFVSIICIVAFVFIFIYLQTKDDRYKYLFSTLLVSAIFAIIMIVVFYKF